MDFDGALDGADVDEVVHAVDAAEEGGFAAAGGSDEGGDLFLGDLEVDVVEGLVFGVEEVEIGDFDGGWGGGVAEFPGAAQWVAARREMGAAAWVACWVVMAVSSRRVMGISAVADRYTGSTHTTIEGWEAEDKMGVGGWGRISAALAQGAMALCGANAVATRRREECVSEHSAKVWGGVGNLP